MTNTQGRLQRVRGGAGREARPAGPGPWLGTAVTYRKQRVSQPLQMTGCKMGAAAMEKKGGQAALGSPPGPLFGCNFPFSAEVSFSSV